MDTEGRKNVVKELLDMAVGNGRLTREEADAIMKRVENKIELVDRLMAKGKTDEVKQLLVESGLRLVSTEEANEPVDMYVTSDGLEEAGMKLIQLLRDKGMNIEIIGPR